MVTVLPTCILRVVDLDINSPYIHVLPVYFLFVFFPNIVLLSNSDKLFNEKFYAYYVMYQYIDPGVTLRSDSLYLQ